MTLFTLKDVAKTLLYQCGALGLRHRRTNRDRLSVVMFHRVLDAADPLFPDADPAYTVTPEFFSSCLDFFRRHYNVVSLKQVYEARGKGPPLPRCPLLITFDDGWGDNLDFAAPLLQAAQIPAVVFVATDPIASLEVGWWQEQLFAAVRCHLLAEDYYTRLATALGVSPSGSAVNHGEEAAWLPLVARLAEISASQRALLLADLPSSRPARRLMLEPVSLHALLDRGFAIGAHGASHAPLTLLENPDDDLLRASKFLASFGKSDTLNALSYPHGRYDARLVDIARRHGFHIQFTSEAALNTMEGGRPTGDVFGRIPIAAPLLSDANGRLRPQLLAMWLFDRPTYVSQTQLPAA